MVVTLPRLYEDVVHRHLDEERQMVFLAGPRQVGKTTIARHHAQTYLSWDDPEHRRLITAGSKAVAERAGLDQLQRRRPVIAFDELHRFGRWKSWLKGFFDVYGEACRVIVTGSSRLDVFRKGGDSLMGRYFLYRLHPLTIAELAHRRAPKAPIRAPRHLAPGRMETLWSHGGFPEPFVRRSFAFTRKWRASRRAQLLREDLRELTQVQELGQLEVLLSLLETRSSEQLVYSNLADDVAVSPDTIKRWVGVLSSLHVGFLVRPYFKNVTKALRKEPKWYLRDWSGIDDVGQRSETLVACHLLKAVEGWTDLGLGAFELRYLRDKLKREVDFLVLRDGKPWFLVEVKHADTKLSPALTHFQQQVGAAHAFQAVLTLPYVDADAFRRTTPTVVPASTLLSQLL